MESWKQLILKKRVFRASWVRKRQVVQAHIRTYFIPFSNCEPKLSSANAPVWLMIRVWNSQKQQHCWDNDPYKSLSRKGVCLLVQGTIKFLFASVWFISKAVDFVSIQALVMYGAVILVMLC